MSIRRLCNLTLFCAFFSVDNYLFDVPEEEFFSMKLTNKIAQQVQVNISKIVDFIPWERSRADLLLTIKQ